MLKVKIIAVGSLKADYWREAAAAYQKRLQRYITLEVVEIQEVMIKDNASDAQIVQALDKEAKQMLKRVKPIDYVVHLAIDGQMFSSEQFSHVIDQWQQLGKRVVFIIGSSYGTSPRIAQRADLQLSLSQMTFPHQMIRVFLLEQMYRSYKILRNEMYHK